MHGTIIEREKVDVYDLITQQFIDALKNEIVPWRRVGMPKPVFIDCRPYLSCLNPLRLL